MARGAAEIVRALDRADPSVRCYLLYGPDEAGSRALAGRLAVAMGADAERIDLAPARLAADPALLADEAASVSLFGGTRHIRVEGAGDDCLAAVEALFAAPAAGNPVVLIAGALKKDARLVKCVAARDSGRVHQSFAPEGLDAERLAIEAGREAGLAIDREVAQRIVAASGNNRALLAREIEKLALFLDAAPGEVRTLDHAALDAIGADLGEADTVRLLDGLFSGNEGALATELALAAAEGGSGITLVRAALRRAVGMVAARNDLDRGATAEAAVGRHVFGREKRGAAQDLPRWSPGRLALLVERLGQIERDLKDSRGAGTVAADQLMMTIARSVRR